ncbi:MAG TPA: Rieske 2Fe-2S domain-containing protein, partial [Kofleriaceae bacterium]|nr:Rieske 2Fe-2S domain-containing protein [Kofleriaceae bacterium]
NVTDVAPGALRGFTVTGVTWPVMVTRIDDQLVAFPGVCPHDDVSLVDYGVLEDGELRCRVHGYRFDLHTGRCEHMPQLHLRRYRVTEIGGEIWVDLL